MKAIIAIVTAISLFSGAGVAFAQDYTFSFTTREANCPAIDLPGVTQFFTVPSTCTRIEHRAH